MSKVVTFFYGSYINQSVLKEVNIYPEKIETAALHGYDVVIKPYANLIKSVKDCVYGILTQLTHEELKRLYSHAEDVFHELYEPESVLVQTSVINGFPLYVISAIIWKRDRQIKII